MEHHIFTGTDIDSCTSYLLFNWFSKKRIPVTYVSRDNIKEKVTKFFNDENQAGKIVYFINIDTSNCLPKSTCFFFHIHRHGSNRRENLRIIIF